MNRKMVKLATLIPLLTMSLLARSECNPDVPFTTEHRLVESPQSRSLIDDTHTGLTWMRCSIGQAWQTDSQTCDGTPATLSWQSALQEAQVSAFAGYSDWRLPNKKELTSIVEYGCSGPAIDGNFFPNTGNVKYWTSTPQAASSSPSVWTVFFYDGSFSTSGLEELSAARLVRGQ